MNTPVRGIHKNLQEIKIPASPFMKNLGYGTGVSVFRLERSPKGNQAQSPWAIKRVSHKSRAQGGIVFDERLKEEAEILRQLSHPNIVGFRGVTKANDGVNSLALECCSTSLGNILEERFEENAGSLPVKDALKMITDIANALNYLHTEARLLHGDIKSYNILVKGDFEICKLCDFGVTIPLDENGVVNFAKNPKHQYVGTDIWSAPEVLNDEDIIDCKADIFSFGLVIYETIALVPPHCAGIDGDENIEPNTSQDLSNESANASTAIVNMYGTRPPLPQAFELSGEYNFIVELFYFCTNELAEDRPDAKTIVEIMKNIKPNKDVKVN
ncbi:lymphokine-activated killer T-cell-originated protein kinase [Teleopsis dalmanni]|uniref:lymphokine-activated killer T-cell-originated protein kinase n=1 Tax=Teleopsis dalmanni TaxID=139649 RepID=UPI0018CCE504|nr:lymphokine-activated killer T-cell-originated protein kinase [Teleopsis dalmanni]XP_037937808.1 lymphokine-activated killer T-cell-originated protein kinase [Teleopsis dalmanni]